MDYHADRFVDASLFVLSDGRRSLRCRRRATATRSCRTGADFRRAALGPRRDGGRRRRRPRRDRRRACGADGVRRLIYKAVPHIYHLAPAEEDLYALQRPARAWSAATSSAAVPPGARPAYSRSAAARCAAEPARRSSWRRATGRALHGAGRRGARGASRVEPVHSAAEMRLLADRFPGRIRLWTASRAASSSPASWSTRHRLVAHAQYIAGGPRGRELRAGDALFDHLLTAVYPDKWFDFGISNEPSGELNAGLMRNKEGFGARAIAYDRYVSSWPRRRGSRVRLRSRHRRRPRRGAGRSAGSRDWPPRPRSPGSCPAPARGPRRPASRCGGTR